MTYASRGADASYVTDSGSTIADAVSSLGPEREEIAALLTARGIVLDTD